MKIDTLGKLVRAVCAAFSEDQTRPSVTLSYLRTGQFYGSIVRYQERYASDKKVVFKATDETIDAVLKSLAQQLLGDKDAMDQLRDAIKEDK